MVRHRLRQSSNLLGPSGLISMEDASIFHRIHIGNHTPGAAIFQKGVRDKEKIEDEFLQNDESGNLPRWEYYREIMGFERRAARSEEHTSELQSLMRTSYDVFCSKKKKQQ